LNLRRHQRRKDVVLVGSTEWSFGATFDCARGVVDQQREGNGEASQSTNSKVAGLGHLSDHGRRSCGYVRNDVTAVFG
jgi:hypothetical protein